MWLLADRGITYVLTEKNRRNEGCEIDSSPLGYAVDNRRNEGCAASAKVHQLTVPFLSAIEMIREVESMNDIA